jgi:glutathione reductase (NADPH)
MPAFAGMTKKVLVAAAHAPDEIERAKAHHGRPAEPDWAADRPREGDDRRHPGFGMLMQWRGVEVIRDRGRFTGPNTVAVGGEKLDAKHIVIATGSKPYELSLPGAELMITSDDALSERNLTACVVFIDGGVIASSSAMSMRAPASM